MLESYKRTGNYSFLRSAIKWYEFLFNKVGFKEYNGNLSVNYFGKYDDSGMVPNVTASTLRMLANLKDVTNDDKYLENCTMLVNWLSLVQLHTGELPYEINVKNNSKKNIHYLCYNYNSFQFLDLYEYYKITLDSNILKVLQKIALFLTTGLTETGYAKFNCHKKNPQVVYYTSALISAIKLATILELGSFGNLADKASKYLLSLQREDGNLYFYSRNNYLVLTDKRSYPRQLAMILHNMLTTIKNK